MFRFSLRSVFLSVAVLAATLAVPTWKLHEVGGEDIAIAQLRSRDGITVQSHGVGPRWLAQLCGKESFQRADSVEIDGMLADPGYMPLVAKLRHLHTLTIEWGTLSYKDARLLGKLRKLQELNLDGTQFDNGDLKHLARLSELSSLSLNHTPIDDEGLEHVSTLKRLTVLDLGWTATGDRELRHLVKLKSLSSLNLTATRITSEGWVTLARLGGWSSLRVDDTDIDQRLKEATLRWRRRGRSPIRRCRLPAARPHHSRRRRWMSQRRMSGVPSRSISKSPTHPSRMRRPPRGTRRRPTRIRC
jgi:hypothetical protein